ncbi:MAG TPA: integrase family protein [Steroidobacteraceae bacterium]|nr:integrase family protein [Steroidobacteraceae bacterium]
MKKLTDASLRALLKGSPQDRMDIRDAAVPGLQLRIGPGGATWSLVVRADGEGGVSKRGFKKKGKRNRLTLGEYPTVSLEDARGRANLYIAQAKKGINPAVALERAATTGGLTIEGLSQKFMAEYVQMKELRASLKYAGTIKVHIVPRVGSALADLISRQDIRDLLRQTMIKIPRGNGPRDRPRGGKEAARTVLSVFRKMMNWGIREELLTRKDNPAEGMEANLPKKRRRDRVLSREECQIAWIASGSLGYPFGPVYRLLFVTGTRESEWGRAIRDWIDLPQALSVIPADSFKSDHVHVVPLVPVAVQTIEYVYAHHPTRNGPYIFSGTDGRRQLGGWSKAQGRLMRAMCSVTGERSVKDFNPHDIRRTVATRIAELLGVGGEQLIRRVLGHADGSVTAIYNRYGYVKEMRQALEQWTGELMRGLSGEPYVATAQEAASLRSIAPLLPARAA